MKFLNKFVDFITAPFNFILKNPFGFNNTTKLSRTINVFFVGILVVLLLLFLVYGKELFM